MGRQDRQGASGLLRHDPDRDISRCRATSAGTTSRSSPGRRSCRCSRRPIRPRSWRSASAPIMADGIEYGVFQLKETGKPIELVYPTEGTPLIVGPNAVFKGAPNPNAARLLQCYMFTAECQQLGIDHGGLRSVHALTGRSPGASRSSRDQADEGRRCGGREAERRDQGALQPDIQGLSRQKPPLATEDIEAGARPASNREDAPMRQEQAHEARCASSVRRRPPPPCTRARCVRLRRRPTAITPALIEAARKEGKLAFYTAMDLAFAQRLAKAVRGEVPRHLRARRALRRRAHLHPHRPGVFEQHPCRRRGEYRRPGALHGLEAEPVAGAVPAGGGREALRQGLLRPRWPARDDAHPGLADRLQHQPGEEGGGAEELRRPARSEVGGQDRQGASRLQRHDHECDVPDRARPRLGVSREARQADASCRCSRRPTRPRRLRWASAPSWPTARDTW